MSKLLRAPVATMQEQRFRCGACDARFAQDVPINVTIDAFLAFQRTIRCPGCGAGHDSLFLGEGRRLDEDRTDRTADAAAPEAARAHNWWNNGERGQSSEAIWRQMLGKLHPGRAEHPRDVDDLRRCLLLLDRVPEWRARMGKMKSLSPEWKALVGVWTELETTMFEECPNLQGAAPRTYALMEQALGNV